MSSMSWVFSNLLLNETLKDHEHSPVISSVREKFVVTRVHYSGLRLDGRKLANGILIEEKAHGSRDYWLSRHAHGNTWSNKHAHRKGLYFSFFNGNETIHPALDLTSSPLWIQLIHSTGNAEVPCLHRRQWMLIRKIKYYAQLKPNGSVSQHYVISELEIIRSFSNNLCISFK